MTHAALWSARERCRRHSIRTHRNTHNNVESSDVTIYAFVCLHHTDAPKSQCSSLSDGESFEGFGEGDAVDSVSSHIMNGGLPPPRGGVDLELAPHLNSTAIG